MIGRGALGGWPALAAHCAGAGLVYLLFVNLTRRKLGAPLIAATLYGAHPEIAARLAADGAWRDASGTALGVLAGILLARTPLQPRLLWPALAAYSAALPLSPGVAAVPFLVAGAIVAYHGLDPARLTGKRLLPRFAAFLAPLWAWIAWCAIEGGDTALGAIPGFVVRAVVPGTVTTDCGAAAGAVIAGVALAAGLAFLRSAPKVAWPLAAAGASLGAAALLTGAWGAHGSFAAALAFVALLAAEGLEELFYRFGAIVAIPLLALVYAALALLSHHAAT